MFARYKLSVKKSYMAAVKQHSKISITINNLNKTEAEKS